MTVSLERFPVEDRWRRSKLIISSPFFLACAICIYGNRFGITLATSCKCIGFVLQDCRLELRHLRLEPDQSLVSLCLILATSSPIDS
jgi:hypothetical protein